MATIAVRIPRADAQEARYACRTNDGGNHAEQLHEINRSIAPRQDSQVQDGRFRKTGSNVLAYSRYGIVLKRLILRPMQCPGDVIHQGIDNVRRRHKRYCDEH